MKMLSVVSNAISAIGYDPQIKRMKIKFYQGRIYDFYGVPQHIFDDFKNANSHGTYYNNYIKGNYSC